VGVLGVDGFEPDSVRGLPADRGSAGSAVSRLRAAADVVEIQQVVLAEREAHTQGWWRQMSACYHEDAEVAITWFRGSAAAFVEQSRELRRRGVMPAVQAGPVTVHLNSPRAVATAGAVLQVPSADGAELTTYMRLLFQLEKRHEAWRISGFRGVARTVPVPRAAAGDSHRCGRSNPLRVPAVVPPTA